MSVNRKPLAAKTARDIESLIREVIIWGRDAERAVNEKKESAVRYMEWHDEACDKLAEYGINVVKFGINGVAR